MKLPHVDKINLSAATGWLQLGNRLEAAAELDRISPEFQSDPDVLLARWLIHEMNDEWSEATEVAKKLFVQRFERAESWMVLAASLEHLAGPTVAFEFLRQAPDHFPRNPMIPFNLAALACRMENYIQARYWLTRSCDVVCEDRERPTKERVAMLKGIAQKASKEPRLKGVWEELQLAAG